MHASLYNKLLRLLIQKVELSIGLLLVSVLHIALLFPINYFEEPHQSL